MPLTITVTPGHTFPEDRAITLDALRKAALPNISIAGAVGTGDLADGAVTPAKSTPGAYWYAAATWLDPTYSISLNPALTGYANGVEVWMKTPGSSDNTGSANLNVNGLGAKPIYKQGGQTLVAGDIRSDRLYGLRYNTSLNAGAGGWELFTPIGNAPYPYATTAGTANAQTVAFTPTIKGFGGLQGQPIHCRIGVGLTNTGPTTLNVDSLGAKSIRKRGDLPLDGGELKAGQIIVLIYDSALNGGSGGFMILSHPDEPVIAGSSRNLVIAIPSVTTVDIDADEIILRGESQDHFVAKAVNLTANITSPVGPNALDFGTEAADTRYFLWIIWNGTTVASLLSASSTSPTMPSGYTHKALVGAVYNNGSSDFDRYWEFGERWRFVGPAAAVPAGAAGVQDVAHMLPAKPRLVQYFLRCKTADTAFAVGDLIEAASAYSTGTAPSISYGANASNVWCAQRAAIAASAKGAGTQQTLTPANWEYFAVAEV